MAKREVERYEVTIGPVPHRRRHALGVTRYYEGGGAEWDVLAYFRSEEAASEFAAIMDRAGLVKESE